MPICLRRPLWLLLIALALVTGCVGLPIGNPSYSTLLIHNTGMDPVVVYVDDIRAGEVGVNSFECIILKRAVPGSRLSFRAISGLPMDAPLEALTQAEGWSIGVHRVSYHELLSLQPAARCIR